MVDASAFAPAGYEIASSVVLLAIMFSGILIGVGKAFSSRRIYSFGVEELFQSIINGAIVGVAFSLTSVLDSIANSASSSSPLFSCSSSESIITVCLCALQYVQGQVSSLLQSTLFAADIIGFVSKLSFSFGSISSTPFFSLENAVSSFGTFQFSLILLLFLLNLQSLILSFLFQYATVLLLPAGIVLRSFFATRRIGGALLGLAIGAYLFFPLSIYLSLSIEEEGWGSISSLSSSLTSFQQEFGAIASSSIGEEENLQEQAQELREGGFLEAVASLLSLYPAALSLLFMQNLIMPLLGLLITAVAVFHLAKLLGGEFAFSIETI